MIKFIKKISCFLLIPIVYFGFNMWINYYTYRNDKVVLNNKRVLILGDSHTKNGVNPSFFSSAQNVSKEGEPYVISYWKLKKIFEHNNIDTLILGLSPNNISGINDLKFSKKFWSPEMFKRSYTIEEFQKIDSKIEVDYTTFYKTLWKQTGFYPKKNHTHFIGKYVNNENKDTTDFNKVIDRHYFYGGKPAGISKVSVQYLDSILNFCEQRNVDVVLVATPVIKEYYEKIPKQTLDVYNKLLDKYSYNHKVFNELNANYPDSLMKNADHLNIYGAEKFSKELRKEL